MVKLIVLAVALIVAYGVGGVATIVTLVIGIALGCMFATKWYAKTGLLRSSRVIRVKRRKH